MIAICNAAVANFIFSLSGRIADIISMFAYKCLTRKRSGGGSEGSLLPYGRGKVGKSGMILFNECMTGKSEGIDLSMMDWTWSVVGQSEKEEGYIAGIYGVITGKFKWLRTVWPLWLKEYLQIFSCRWSKHRSRKIDKISMGEEIIPFLTWRMSTFLAINWIPHLQSAEISDSCKWRSVHHTLRWWDYRHIKGLRLHGAMCCYPYENLIGILRLSQSIMW